LVLSAVIPLFMNQEETDNLYLIPEGYEGEIYTFYNVKGAPKVKIEDGYRVHPINTEGYHVTSTEELSTGLVTDQYFFVDDNGKRTPINENCIRGFGIGGHQTSLDEEIDLQYTGFEVTKNECSEEFRWTGSGMGEHHNQLIWRILKEYYGVDSYW
jgi:hypothetical protein